MTGLAELACLQLTTTARRDIARYVRRALPELGTTSCAGLIRGALDLLDDAAVSALREVKVSSVSISGETATAQLEGRSDPVSLIRDDGTWKIVRLQFLRHAAAATFARPGVPPPRRADQCTLRCRAYGA